MQQAFSTILKRGSILFVLLASAHHAAAELAFEGFWVRAMPPTQTMTAAYGRIINQGAEAVVITDVTATAAQTATFHDSRQSGDQVRMVAMGDVSIESGDVLELSPGGAHLMLMGIETMPAMGTTVEICVHSQTSKFCTAAPVQRDAMPMDHHHH
ncbi:MAG: copper chaperone PCu(A)C [Luminiphilus sp.]|nr:copper chaperone PCu(A)C [Luminiphilus sp.]